LREKVFEIKKWLFLGVSILSLVGFYIILSWFLEIDKLLYLKNIYAQAFVKDMNPTKELSNFNWDIFFYLKYIRDFENSVLWLGWASMFYFGRKKITNFFQKAVSTNHSQFFSQSEILGVISICFLCGMSILVKAPRGLLFVYPLLFCFAFTGLNKLVRNKALKIAIFSFTISYNIWNLERFIYQYSETNYQKTVEYLEEQNAQKLYTSVGLGITPFLSQEIVHKNLFSLTELDERNPTQSYLLIDDYWRIAQLGSFEILEKQSESKWEEKSLQSPYLYLELCEFTGNSYEEAMKQWEESSENTYLRLIPLPLQSDLTP
jgi:hypothetical protein